MELAFELTYQGRYLPPIFFPILGGMIVVTSALRLLQRKPGRRGDLFGPGGTVTMIFSVVVGLGLMALGWVLLAGLHCGPFKCGDGA